MTYTGAHHQGVIKKLWFHFWEPSHHPSLFTVNGGDPKLQMLHVPHDILCVNYMVGQTPSVFIVFNNVNLIFFKKNKWASLTY